LRLRLRPLHQSGTHHAFKEIDMTQARFSLRFFLICLALTAILVIALALVVVAQEEDDGEPIIRRTETTVPAEGGEPVSDPAAPNATAYFLFLSANTFVPYEDDMTYQYGGSGCVYRTGGASYSEHSVQLPQGAEITQVRLFFYDNDSVNNAEVQLYSFPGDGTNEKLVDLESVGTPGQVWLDSAPFSHIVDNSAEALSVRLDYQSSSNNDVEICGVRIRYQYSPSITSLPLILNAAGP
jgi:hypothetical protein